MLLLDNPVVPMGFEFTFQPKVSLTRRKADKYILRKLEQGLEAKLDKLGNLGFYPDFGNLEVNSPVFTKTEAILKYYSALWELVKDDFVVKLDDWTGGGCHIHANCNEAFALKVQKVLYHNHYLSWAFNDPYDDINACPLPYADELNTYNKAYLVRFAGRQLKGNTTIEFRFFDNPNSLEELVAYVKTVNTIFAMAKTGKYPKDGPVNAYIKSFEAFKKTANIKFSNERLLGRLELEGVSHA